ncbi:MAG: ATP-binding protein [Candidatus Cloacimonetes bacterium]|nr:ATP-binding protein [Candidatus Cloacimonadota bacterium]
MAEKYSKNIFPLFSILGFFLIFVSSFITYIVSAYQINRTYVEQQLMITGENIKLQLTRKVSAELAMLQNLGRSPVIREYFVNPDDAMLKNYALTEFEIYHKHSSQSIVFWANDKDKIFHAIGAEAYLIDPDLEENYWYNLTLYETEELNFNINYNPDLDIIYLWVNIPVFEDIDVDVRKPIGMLGTGLNLDKIIELVDTSCSDRSQTITAYLFNQYDEITIANDFDLMDNKVLISDHLGTAGEEIVRIARTFEGEQEESFIYGTSMYHVGSLEAIKDWYMVLHYEMPGMFAMAPQMNLIFFGMLFLIFALLVVMNFFVTKTNKDMSDQNTRLYESNEKLNMVVQATKIGLWDVDIADTDLKNPNTKFNWSDEFRQMLGYNDINDFPNLESSWRDKLHPDDKEETLEHFRKHVHDTTGSIPYDVEYRLLTQKGEYEYFRAYGGTFRDNYGSPLRVVGSLINITETKNMLIDLEKQRILAEVASKAKSDFLAKISHEIRTPMNAIIGISQIQLQKYTEEDSYSEALEKIHHSACSLLGIINDILDLSKIETGKMEINDIEYYVPSLLHDAVQLNILQIGSKRLEFILDLDETLPSKLIGDELRIKQILNNLLSNAIKYSTKGYVKLSASFQECSDSNENSNEGYLNLTVEDTGQGLKPEDCEKLFSEYMRFNIKETRTVQGTGIGLNITKSLVEMMGGNIKVDSEYGVGSKFSVSVKQKTLDCEPIGEELAKQLSSFTFSGKKHHTSLQITREAMPYGSVLVVDDIESNLFVANGLLMPYQLTVETALSGEDAIALIKSGKEYDIIFMDHMMPEMDGIEATNILRKLEYKGIIVALTANAVSGNAEMFKQNGFDDFISKPIDIRILNTVLNTYVRDRHTEEHSVFKSESIQNSENNTSGYDERLLSIFIKDVQKAIITLKETTQNSNIKLFTTTVHGVKSVLASLGHKETSEKAAELENAGLNEDLNFILEKTSDFIVSLENILNQLKKDDSKDRENETIEEDKEFLIEQLNIIKSACEVFDDITIYEAIKLLKTKSWTKDTMELIDKIYNDIYLHSNFQETIDELSANGIIKE